MYEQEDRIPKPDEYIELRLLCGLSSRSREAAQIGLGNSLFGTSIKHNGLLVGMGRVVGDGGCNFEVVDIAVHPDHQRKGLGAKLMTSLMTFISNVAPSTAYVSLIADAHSPKLYQKFGFQPTAPASIGMALRVAPSDEHDKRSL